MTTLPPEAIPPEVPHPEAPHPEAPPPAPVAAEATVRPHYGERAIAEAQLICFDNPRAGRIYEVTITLPEFT